MSDTITLGKSRKDGKWSVLVQPERPFGEHLDAYRKIANKHPVNDEFSRVIIGKLHHSSPALLLVTTAEAKDRAKAAEEREQSIIEIVNTAGDRQKEILDRQSKERQEEHEAALEEKNAMINRMRKDTNQPVAAKPVPPKKADKVENKLLDEYKDLSKEDLAMIQSSSAEVLGSEPENKRAKLVNDAATELLKKFN